MLTGLTDKAKEVDLCPDRRKTARVWVGRSTIQLMGGEEMLKLAAVMARSA